MARWEPDPRGRLIEAAMDLYRERGFDQTTVADIAARAGLTERTFFRHFTDKREVLFDGSHKLEALLLDRVTSAPAGAAPLDIVVAALEEASAFFEERRDFARKRRPLILAHPELKERELIKLASWAAAIGDALRRRGVPGAAAGLAGETGIALLKLAFNAWLDDAKKRDLTHHLRASRAALEAVTAGVRRRQRR
jgi:AcrR family transcriptional regulator